MRKVLVLGASLSPDRYSNRAMLKLQSRGFKVSGLGIRPGIVNGMEILTEPVPIDDLYAVTIYLNPDNQRTYFDYIVALKPQKVIFNPGAENEEFRRALGKNGISAENACTLVLLSLDSF